MKHFKLAFICALILGMGLGFNSCAEDEPFFSPGESPEMPDAPPAVDNPVDLSAITGIVSSSPEIVQHGSKDVVVYFDASKGNRGLAGFNGDVYAHIGYNTKDGQEWQGAPAWGDNSSKYRLTKVGADLWSLNLGNLADYFGLNGNAAEKINALAMVFRSSDGSREGKGEGNSDIFMDVLDNGFKVLLQTSQSSDILMSDSDITFRAVASEDADLTISVNGTEISGSQMSIATSPVVHRFAQQGEHKVTARGYSASGELSEYTLTYSYIGSSKPADYPGGNPVMGTVVNGTDVTFCIAAPGKSNVILYGSWNDFATVDSQVMNYTDTPDGRFFWTTVGNINPSTDYLYYFLVDGEYAVGDPYAKLVLDPYSDKYLNDKWFPSYPTKIKDNTVLSVHRSAGYKYNWKVNDFNIPNHDNLVIYELLFRDFTGTEGASNANGTVRQAIEKIDYLKKLGVNAVELMPIMEFNGNNSWGYNTNFYFAPDKAYGTPEDYKEFIDKCHQNGMAVILDIVFNQSDGLHPWYVMYGGVRNNPFYNASAPHDYSVLNDWNQDNPLVARQWEDCLRYWMEEYKVDGFRFDLVKGLGDNGSYGGSSESNTNKYNASRVRRMKALHKVLTDINPNAIHINEHLAGAQEENEMGADGQLNWANVNDQSCQFAMGWSDNGGDANLKRFYAGYDSRTIGTTVSYAESHDEQRMAYKQQMWANGAIKTSRELQMRRLGSVAAQMLMSPGAHMIWQFGEFGADENTKNDSGNDTGAKKVVWSYASQDHRKDLLNSYRELNAIRNANPELFTRTSNFSVNGFTNGNADKRVMKNTVGGKEIVTMINQHPSETQTITAQLSGNGNYTVLSSSPCVGSADVKIANGTATVSVPAGAYVVIGNVSK